MRGITMRLFNAIALTFTVVLTASQVAADDAKSIVGRYMLVGGEEDGKPVPPERIKGSVVVIDDERIYGTDKDKKEIFAASYKLDRTTKPWKIMMTSKSPKIGEKAEGVVKVEGDAVWICYGLPGGKTPTDFKAGEKQHCFKLKKTAKLEKK
jgi:uncharacterized protein (TIGR03067 family)